MELYGLKSSDGKEWKIDIPGEYKDGVLSADIKKGIVYPCEPEPKFKVGQWVHTSLGNGIRRIFAITRDRLIYLDYMDGEDQYSKNPFTLHIVKGLATEEEIESHLRKICDEKYKKGMTVKDADDGLISVITGDSAEEYRETYDTLVISSTPKGHDFEVTNLYCKGKFAEIISEKKKLPKTKEGIRQIIVDYDDWWHEQDRDFTPIDEFLDQYED